MGAAATGLPVKGSPVLQSGQLGCALGLAVVRSVQ